MKSSNMPKVRVDGLSGTLSRRLLALFLFLLLLLSRHRLNTVGLFQLPLLLFLLLRLLLLVFLILLLFLLLLHSPRRYVRHLRVPVCIRGGVRDIHLVEESIHCGFLQDGKQADR